VVEHGISSVLIPHKGFHIFFISLNFAAKVVFGILILAYFGMRSFGDTWLKCILAVQVSDFFFIFFILVCL